MLYTVVAHCPRPMMKVDWLAAGVLQRAGVVVFVIFPLSWQFGILYNL
jgi:hypothetical protein